ncbi:MAG: adenylate/guanylate cyclase domain-containing protein [Candidatus Binatia bacterium]
MISAPKFLRIGDGKRVETLELNAIWQQQDLPTVEMRIGIFTGPVVAGSLGSAQRLKYTTVGRTENG